jgi:hypothetical protein
MTSSFCSRPIVIYTLLGLLLSVTAQASSAQSINVLGRSIELPVPAGYCLMESHPADQAITARNADVRSKTSQKVLQYSVPCEDRALYRAGKLKNYARYASVILVGRNGEWKIDPRPREQVLDALSKGAVDIASINKRLATHTAAVGGVQIQSHQILGRDTNAAYWAVFVEAQGKQQVSAIGAAVPFKQLPVLVAFYAPPETMDPEATARRLAAYAADVIAKN